MEYLTVTFDPHNPREVLASGKMIGKTDTQLTVPADFYHLTLSGDGYKPPFWEGPVAGTLPTSPLVVIFTHA